jgi:PAS domain S-box-containing protein
MISDIFHNIIRIGADDQTDDRRHSELKLINSISLHSFIFTLLSAIAGLIIMPEHWMLIVFVALTEMIGKTAVLMLNSIRKFMAAKVVFTFITLISFLTIVAYFGVGLNFQYLIITTFFTLVIVFRNGNPDEILLTGLYLLIGMISLALIYIYDQPIVLLSESEIWIGRFISYSMNLGLVIMVVVIFLKSSAHKKLISAQNLAALKAESSIIGTIARNMNDGIFKSQPETGFVFVNAAFANIFGFDFIEKVLVSNPVTLYHSESERDDLIEEIRLKGVVSNRLIHYRKQDGSRFWGRLSCKLIIEDDIDYLVGTVTDITVQQEQEDMLRENEEQLKESQQLANMGNWQLFNASKILRWSEECTRIHGYNSIQTDYDYREWLAGLDDMNESTVETLMAKAMMTRESLKFQSWYTTPDGERKFLAYITKYGRSDKTRGGVWYGTVQDITQQHLAEQIILDTKQFYEAWIDELPIESIVFDEQKRFRFISKNAIKDEELRKWLTGKTNKEYAETKGLSKAFYEQRDEMVEKVFKDWKTQSFEEEMVGNDGKTKHHLRFLIPFHLSENGRMKRVVIGYSFDLTDIKSAQNELIQSNEKLIGLNKDLDRFVYSISHDLRAPIASLIGINNLSKEVESLDEMEEMLTMQAESLQRMDGYISDILDYSRNKRLKLNETKIDIKDTIEKCLKDLRFYGKDESLKVSLLIETDEIFTDELRFKIIVNNLLSNALKYTDNQKVEKWVELRSFVEGDYTVIEVEDNGIGIRADLIDGIWDMFFRATSDFSGSGLGLYILKESAQALQARLSVESKEGVGSKFRVEFPSTVSD